LCKREEREEKKKEGGEECPTISSLSPFAEKRGGKRGKKRERKRQQMPEYAFSYLFEEEHGEVTDKGGERKKGKKKKYPL